VAAAEPSGVWTLFRHDEDLCRKSYRDFDPKPSNGVHFVKDFLDSFVFLTGFVSTAEAVVGRALSW